MRQPRLFAAALLFTAALASSTDAFARERFAGRFAERRAAAAPASVPANVRVWRDQPYGSDPRQRYDVYAPAAAKQAPTLFLVHGGAWKVGDKNARGVVEAKVAHWTAQGYVVISTNYRLLPEADPLMQARDVADAISSAQRNSARWGGNPVRFVLVGHSAGAHLVALLAASPSMLEAAKARPAIGAVLLDSAVLDAERLMSGPHLKLYDEAFAADPAYWRAVSPYRQLSSRGAPILAVCSSQRRASCVQARAFADEAARIGRQAQVLEQDLSHAAINAELGKAGAYTANVDRFLRGL